MSCVCSSCLRKLCSLQSISAFSLKFPLPEKDDVELLRIWKKTCYSTVVGVLLSRGKQLLLYLEVDGVLASRPVREFVSAECSHDEVVNAELETKKYMDDTFVNDRPTVTPCSDIKFRVFNPNAVLDIEWTDVEILRRRLSYERNERERVQYELQEPSHVEALRATRLLMPQFRTRFTRVNLNKPSVGKRKQPWR